MDHRALVGLFVAGVTQRRGRTLLLLADSSGGLPRGLRLYIDAEFEIDPDAIDPEAIVGFEDGSLGTVHRLRSRVLGGAISAASLGDAGGLVLEFGGRPGGEVRLSISGTPAVEGVDAPWEVTEG
jgi:hypothetical protein